MRLAPQPPVPIRRWTTWGLVLALATMLALTAQHTGTARASAWAWSNPATTLAGPQGVAGLGYARSGVDAAGIVTVVWDQETAAGHDRVMAARYPATGALIAISGPVDLTASIALDPSARYSDVAVSPNGDTVAAWTQPASGGGNVRSVWVSHYSASGNAWTGPTELPGPVNALNVGASRPVIAAGPQGQFTVAWFGATGGNPNGTGAFAAARYDGTSWSQVAAISPVYPLYSEDWSIAGDPGIAADGLGNVMVLWVAKKRAGGPPEVSKVLSTRYSAGGGWAAAATPTVVFAAGDNNGGSVSFDRPSVEANATGAFVAAWRNFENPSAVTQAARYHVTGWGSKQDLPGPSGRRSNPSIAIDAAGTATIAWVDWDADVVRSSTSRATTPETWELSTTAPAGGVAASGDVQIGASAAGDITAVWDGENATTNQYTIQANHLPSGSSTWSQPTTLQTGAYQDSNWYDVVQYPTLAVAPSGVATAVWENVLNYYPDSNSYPAQYLMKASRYAGPEPEPDPAPQPGPDPAPQPAGGETPAATTTVQSAGTPTSTKTGSAEVRIPSQLANAGIPVTTGGLARLPLSCPSGLLAACDASGQLTVTLPGTIVTKRGRTERAAGGVRVLARFRGVEIASGTTRLHTVRLAPKAYNALRKAGVRRIPATLRISNQLAGGAPVLTTQRIWLQIRLLGPEPVTG